MGSNTPKFLLQNLRNINLKIIESKRDKFKIYAAMQRKSMTEILENYVDSCIENILLSEPI